MHMLRRLLALKLLCLVSKKQIMWSQIIKLSDAADEYIAVNHAKCIRNKGDVISPFTGRVSSIFSIATNLYGQMEL